jgi:GT2 family glycosyltransferase
VIVTLLTGRRPDLLAKTLASLEGSGIEIDFFVNGADTESLQVVHDSGIVNSLHHWPEWLGIGAAMNRVAEHVAGEDGYWLHLEDDWELTRPIDIRTAQAFLDDHPEVGQVRLRRRDDGASHRHYLTKRRINWQGEGIKIGNAHATWNPALQRTSAAQVYPVTGEVDFMRKMPQINAQTDPGHFRHLGEGRSLR